MIWLSLAFALGAQERPGLFFREDWKETAAETPVTQAHVANPELQLAVHGPGRAGVKKSHHDKPADDPYYIWSGTAEGNWAVALRHRKSDVDLTGQARIVWRSKQAGFRHLRIVVKLAGGQWLVSNVNDGPSADWRVTDFPIANARWRKLNVDSVLEGDWISQPDLSRVEQVGFTDLMTGGASAACSRLDWIEVYGKPVPRK